MPAPPATDADVPRFVDALGLPGLVDIHVHFMPDPVQQAVWSHFDQVGGPWGIRYRTGAAERLATLRQLRTVAHTALAYAHRPSMAEWLNRYTLDLAAAEPQVVPTFTFFPEPGVETHVEDALERGGRCAKVHLQVSKFSPHDPRLDHVWVELERRGTAVVIHAGAVPDGSGGEAWCGVGPVARLAERFPELPLVVAHLGAPEVADFVALAERTPSVHLDTASILTDPPVFDDPPPAVIDRILSLPDRVVYGTDFPSIPHEVAAQLRGLAAVAPDAAWLRGVLHRNPARLLQIEVPEPDG
jgi:uncharacterized protein